MEDTQITILKIGFVKDLVNSANVNITNKDFRFKIAVLDIFKKNLS